MDLSQSKPTTTEQASFMGTIFFQITEYIEKFVKMWLYCRNPASSSFKQKLIVEIDTGFTMSNY